MQAIILAAGMGKRLGDLTMENTKCMVKVNGEMLIDRMLRQLYTFNLNRIVIVIGYKGDILENYLRKNHADKPIEFVYNPIYYKTNNIYSLYLAKEQLLEDDTILLESDLIFEDCVLHKLVNHPDSSLVLVDQYKSWMDGTVVTLDEGNNIISFIPQSHFRFEDKDNYFKTVNIYKFSKSFSGSHYVPFLEAYIKALGQNEYYEQVLRVIALLDRPEIKALPLNGEDWYEIDDIEDLRNAELLFSSNDLKLHTIQKRYGGYWRFPKLLDFCYLVNPFFPPKRMIQEFNANFADLLRNYPSGQVEINSLASKSYNVDDEYLAVGNGAAELIELLMRRIEGKVGVVYPTFEEYPNRLPKERIVSFIPSKEDFSYNSEDLQNYFSGKSIDNLILINPDNPSGNLIRRAELFDLVGWCKNENIRLILDESFVDFADSDKRFTIFDNEFLANNSHVVAIKSISKSYGVPGLRLGILATSDKELLQYILREISIWNINSFAEFYLQIFNKYQNDYNSASLLFQKERQRFYQELQNIKFLRVIPSQANYFLCEVVGEYSAKELTELLLCKSNIFIKNCEDKIGFEKKDYIRIAVRSPFENDQLINVLKAL